MTRDELLSLARQPMTEREIIGGFELLPEALTFFTAFEAGVRHAERHHRIDSPHDDDQQQWRLVPVTPTPEMLAAVSWPGCAATDYAHMLAAAPQPPSAFPFPIPKRPTA